MNVLDLNHVAIPVSDLELSCQFYSEVLKLGRMSRPNFSFPGAWFRLGTRELHLLCRPSPEGIPHNSEDRHFALEVSSFKEALEHLKRHQITHRPSKQRPDGVWQVFLRDPDGHSIELTSPDF